MKSMFKITLAALLVMAPLANGMDYVKNGFSWTWNKTKGAAVAAKNWTVANKGKVLTSAGVAGLLTIAPQTRQALVEQFKQAAGYAMGTVALPLAKKVGQVIINNKVKSALGLLALPAAYVVYSNVRGLFSVEDDSDNEGGSEDTNKGQIGAAQAGPSQMLNLQPLINALQQIFQVNRDRQELLEKCAEFYGAWHQFKNSEEYKTNIKNVNGLEKQLNALATTYMQAHNSFAKINDGLDAAAASFKHEVDSIIKELVKLQPLMNTAPAAAK